jgi:dTDP-4-amino-4,6-dideoxygalactose transaminase
LRKELLRIDRDGFIAELRKRNIGASVHFIPLHLQHYYRERYGLREGDFPGAEQAFSRIVSLPIWPGMSDDDIDDVLAAVAEIVSEFSS